MKTQAHRQTHGSVLLIAILTLTILTGICATTLYITTQNTNSTSQTASWQAALSGAESGVEHGYYALNKNIWTGWQTVTGSLPNVQPTGGTAATTAPTTGKYAYFVQTLQVAGEGGGTVKFWVTIDTAGLALDRNGNQWYRIRSTGLAAAPGPPRVSNQKQDNDLRKISLRTDRLSGLALATPQAARRIEVIAAPVPSSVWTRGITLRSSLTMNGTGIIDSFDSSNGLFSTNHFYDLSKHLSHADVGIVNSTGSDLKDRYVYGNVAYSGPAIKNTKNVQGTISSPFPATILNTGNPVWSSGTYTSYSGGNPPVATVTATATGQPLLIKVNGDFNVPGGAVFAINSSALNLSANQPVIIWVTGKLATSGSGVIVQDPKVKVTWYVDDDITLDGDSYHNLSGYAANMNIIGVGNHQANISGNSNFVATLNAPGYDVSVSGNGSFVGALVGRTLDIGGSAGFHYDEAIAANGNSNAIANYSYASWFEDNADVPRGQTY
ncbi:MAG TPA: hypothetical protein VGK72_13690 [Chthoniobacterales bacterium]